MDAPEHRNLMKPSVTTSEQYIKAWASTLIPHRSGYQVNSPQLLTEVLDGFLSFVVSTTAFNSFFNFMMQLITAFTLFSLALGVVAGPRRSYHRRGLAGPSARRAQSATGKVPKTNTLAATGPYKLDHKYEGEAFFNEWDFFTEPDPTHGFVNYQTKDFAMQNGLATVDGNQTILAVDDQTWIAPSTNRNSVRLQTQQTYNGGLFIADFAAMPFGCSVWPAYWSVGPNWPGGGEIDILEGVNNQDTNQYTLHTSADCTLSTGGAPISGKTLNQQCASSGADNTGCAFKDSDTRSYGEGFNNAGGGVFVHQWDDSGIKAWHFARSEIPADILSGSDSLDPSQWGTPAAVWSSGTCDMGSHFFDHKLVLDITLCGDWAGATFSSSPGCSGQCGDAVADPNNFTNAKFKINYIAVYQP